MAEEQDHPTLRLGISQCLLGDGVRYDGGHKRDPFLVETLGRWVQWVPVCPEVELGLGVPRPTLRLERDPVETGAKPRLRVLRTDEDLTDRMERWSRSRVKELASENLDGYVLKRSSPSCGMERVKVYGQGKGPPDRNGVGVFARVLNERMPLLPREEEGRLHDPGLRESFIEHVFTYRRWRTLLEQGPGPKDLVRFHSRHKMALLAHHPQRYRQMGRLVSEAGRKGFRKRLARYGEELMTTLGYKATRRKHANVLYHLAGYLKRELDGDDKEELGQLIEQYRTGLVPLVVPVTLLRHHFRRHPVEWVLEQTYLSPYPYELMLRNHV